MQHAHAVNFQESLSMEWVSISQIDGSSLRSVFACFPSGVVALCALIDGVPTGMAISSFTSVSLEPALVSICIQKSSSTWQKLERCDWTGLSILGASQAETCRQLSQKTGDRFANVEWSSSPRGAVFINGAIACLECRFYKTVDAGDHILALLELSAHSVPQPAQPLVFHDRRFRELAV